VAARPIARGTVLSTADIVARVVSADDSVASTQVGPGWIARRPIREGEPLRSPAVAPPPLVHGGTDVRFRLQHEDLQLLLPGRALSSGALGDTILVRLDARRRFRGVVSGPGLVIALPDSTRNK
jgi:flagella basal body P-ring formation protein FlgA